MPLHDWEPVPSGLFHHFHQDWSIEITRVLNRGLLPDGTIALVEQRAGPLEPDVLAIETRDLEEWNHADSGGGTATLQLPANTITQRASRDIYARKANRIVIRHHLGRIVAVIEIVSPGNKDGQRPLQRFVDKTTDFLADGISVLVVDLFPPTSRDPQGIHKLIWNQFKGDDPFILTPGKDRVFASYEASIDLTAYVTTAGVGDPLPDMPLFLTRELSPNLHVIVPLQSTYEATWEATPKELRRVVETGIVPDPE